MDKIVVFSDGVTELFSCSVLFVSQLDEDMKTLLQRYEGETEENTDSNEASSLSYLEHLASLNSNQARLEVAQRAEASKKHTERLLLYMEKSGACVQVLSQGVCTIT